MTTAEDYESLSGWAYFADPLKQDPPLVGGSRIPAQGSTPKYLVLHAATDPLAGFQRMAVVPLVNGAPDHSQQIVSYAGTNPDHRADAIAGEGR